MPDRLTVLMGDSVAGVLRRTRAGVEFRYDDAYRSAAGATPISVSMPLQIDTHSDRAVTPWLWGLLPDNDAVLRRWARRFDASVSSAFSLLSTPVGEDCAGAIRFAVENRLEAMLARPGTVVPLSDHEVAERLRALRADATAWLGEDFGGKFSLAGAQAKTALLFDNGRWALPSGRAATSHILKPAIAGLDDHDLNEHLCLEAARRCGLIAVRTRIERFEDTSAIVIDRYDRVPTGELYERMHQEDVCQALGVPPSQKYEADGGPGAAAIVRLIRRVMPARIADQAVARFVDAVAWNWLIAGTDAHAKNYAILLAGDDVRLAPLYDVASALPYLDLQRLSLAMKLGGSYRLGTHGVGSWQRFAKEVQVDADAVVERVSELARALPDAFRDAIAQPAVQECSSPMPQRLHVAVSHRANEVVRSLQMV